MAARDENNTGIVQVVWFQGATIWDYDLHVYDRLAYMMSNCFPIQFKANHLCCLPRIVARLIKPIIHSFLTKDMRIHTIQHDVPENEVIEVLSNYGLYRNMLPTQMGGTVTLDLTRICCKTICNRIGGTVKGERRIILLDTSYILAVDSLVLLSGSCECSSYSEGMVFILHLRLFSSKHLSLDAYSSS